MRLLIVVDYQVDFVDGALGFAGAEKLDERIAARIDEYRASGDEVAFTLDTHDEGYLDTAEGKRLPIPHCIIGTHGHELYGRTAERLREGDACFAKHSFGSLELADYLRTRSDKYDSIELCGLVSDICVLSNAVIAKAACPEARIFIDRALTASPSDVSLDILKSVHIDLV